MDIDVLDLEQACRSLTPRQQQILACWLQGYTQREIASLVGLSQKAVWKHLHAAFRELHEKLV